jgi:uncharacterized membrane protein/protein-disulfide isomerase
MVNAVMEKRRVLGVSALALAIVGFAASIASLIDFMSSEPMLCSDSGCATVRQSVWAHPLGIPMPVLGVVFYGAMIVLAFLARPRLRKLLAIAGGAWAVFLIVLQAFVIEAWCKLCMIADPVAIAHAIVVVAGASAIRFTIKRVSIVVPVVGLLLLPLALWSHQAKPTAPDIPVPECVAREQVPGRVTIVEFVDFECPFCRAMQERLTEALHRAGSDIRLVRKMVPLPQHKHALTAAVAWCCADAQGRGDVMADELFAADPKELTIAGCEKLAEKVGLDMDKYRAAMKAPETIERLKKHLVDADAAKVDSLPTLYIGGERLMGAAASVDELVATIDRARD